MSANFGIGSVGLNGGGNDALVSDDGQLHTVMASKVDEGNSSSDTLMAGVTFTGEEHHKDRLDFRPYYIKHTSRLRQLCSILRATKWV